MTEPDVAAERTVWEGTPSQAVNAPAWVALALGALGASVGLEALKRATAARGGLTERTAEVFGWLTILIWAGFALLMIVQYLRVRTTRYQITTERLRVTTGILSTETDELELRRVRDFRIVRPFLARMLGLGHIHLISGDASTPRVTLRAVRDPDQLQATIRSIVQQLYRRQGVREIDVL